MTKVHWLALLASAASLLASSAFAETPTLPVCKTGSRPVTLVIKTDTTSGWTVNGVPVAQVSNSAWVSVSPAVWIGTSAGTGPGQLVYKISFSAPAMHGPMSVTAKWAADNCGGSLQAGTGAPVSTGACFQSPSPNGKDFMAFTHVTTANFAPADNTDPNPTITFIVNNQNGTAAGLGGVFTITAQCVCRG